LRNEEIVGGTQRQRRFLCSCKLCSRDSKTSIRTTLLASGTSSPRGTQPWHSPQGSSRY